MSFENVVKSTIDEMIDGYKKQVDDSDGNDVCGKSNIVTLNILKFKLGLD